MKRPIVILVLAPMLCGCTYSTYHGDAQLVHLRGFIGETKLLVLPKVELRESETWVFRVRDLPFPIFPTNMEIPLYDIQSQVDVDFGRPPWADCTVSIHISSPDGQNIYAEDARLMDMKSGGHTPLYFDRSSPRVRRYTTLRLSPPPPDWTLQPLLSYDVTIVVHTPSSRDDDWLRFLGVGGLDRRTDEFVQQFAQNGLQTRYQVGGP